MDDPARKRRYPVDKNILIFTNCMGAQKCAALFEFKMTITRGLDGKIVLDPHLSNKDKKLDLIGVFYDHRRTPEINSVAACVLGSNLYVIPHDEDIAFLSDHPEFQFYLDEYDLNLLKAERETLAPCIFDLKKEKKINQDMPQFPKARKTDPILTCLSDTTIFALSTLSPFLNVPEPCFESLDPKTFIWTPLDCPPFHKNNNKDIFDDSFCVTGYVLLEDEGFILVSILERHITSYYSYNILSKTWSSRVLPPVDTTDFILKHYMHDEAVVVHNNIYTYYPWFKQLLVFSYSFDATSCGLSLGPMGKVGGDLEFEETTIALSRDPARLQK